MAVEIGGPRSGMARKLARIVHETAVPFEVKVAEKVGEPCSSLVIETIGNRGVSDLGGRKRLWGKEERQ